MFFFDNTLFSISKIIQATSSYQYYSNSSIFNSKRILVYNSGFLGRVIFRQCRTFLIMFFKNIFITNVLHFKRPHRSIKTNARENFYFTHNMVELTKFLVYCSDRAIHMKVMNAWIVNDFVIIAQILINLDETKRQPPDTIFSKYIRNWSNGSKSKWV